MVDINPWHPITDPVTLKHIGKLLEELGELTAALSRCLIQGVDEAHPTTGKINRDWLQDEIADVWAGIDLLDEHLNLSTFDMEMRAERKKEGLSRWHEMA